MRDAYSFPDERDRGGRHSGIERRRFFIFGYAPERRSNQGRRSDYFEFFTIFKWLKRRKLKKQLRDCNFTMASEIVARYFSAGTSKDKLMPLLDSFYKNPSIETAVALLEYAPNLIPLFKLALYGRITEFIFRRGLSNRYYEERRLG